MSKHTTTGTLIEVLTKILLRHSWRQCKLNISRMWSAGQERTMCQINPLVFMNACPSPWNKRCSFCYRYGCWPRPRGKSSCRCVGQKTLWLALFQACICRYIRACVAASARPWSMCVVCAVCRYLSESVPCLCALCAVCGLFQVHWGSAVSVFSIMHLSVILARLLITGMTSIFQNVFVHSLVKNCIHFQINELFICLVIYI